MQPHTRPALSPKSPYPCRAEALRSGELLDLEEFELSSPQLPGAAMPWAISEGLLELVEEVPFALKGTADPHQRLLRLVARAGAALERARQGFGIHFVGALMSGFVLDFVAELPCRASDPHYRFVRLHCGPDEDGEIAATLVRLEEF